MQWFHFVLALCVLVLFQQGTINVQWQQTNWQGFVNCSIVSLASAGPGGTNLFALTNEEADIQKISCLKDESFTFVPQSN